MKPIEGQFLLTDENLIFEVKGILHPSDRVIAFLRYIPTKLETHRRGYKKIYSLVERYRYLETYYPEYLWRDSIHDRIMQAVPVNKIKRVLDPVKYLQGIRERNSSLDPIRLATLRLANRIVTNSGIEWTDIGVTGSILAEKDSPQSDIDLIIYGQKQVKQVHIALESYRNKIGLISYESETLFTHVKNRWGQHPEHIMKTLYEVESKKKFQGIFSGHDVFIRGVKKPSEIIYKYGDLRIKRGPRKTIVCQVIDDQQALFTPCEYVVTSRDHPTLTKLVSFRGRFTEHVKEGDIVKARGVLEHVIDKKSGNEYQQLVMGEDPRDILIPVD